jgi:hypothetical protein
MTRIEDLTFRGEPRRRGFLYDVIGFANGFEILVYYREGDSRSHKYGADITPPEEMNRGVLTRFNITAGQVNELLEKTECGRWEESHFPELAPEEDEAQESRHEPQTDDSNVGQRRIETNSKRKIP